MGDVLSFDSKYYASIIREYGYDPVGFSSVPMMPALANRADEQALWCCSYNVEAVLDPDGQTLFSTGVGMSGCPHMGTVSQIAKAKMLQEAGYRVQLVLGDIDAYTGRNITWSKTQELAERYSHFITALGFSSDILCPRRQSTSEYMLTCLSLVARHMSYELACDSEEDLQPLVMGDGNIARLLVFELNRQGLVPDVLTRSGEWPYLDLLQARAMGSYEDLASVAVGQYDLLFECVGFSQAKTLPASLRCARPGATLLFLGVYPETYEIPLRLRPLFEHEYRIYGVRSFLRSDFSEAVQQMERCFGELSRAFPLRIVDAQDVTALEECLRHPSASKVVIDFMEGRPTP